jgi:hypothetical protein
VPLLTLAQEEDNRTVSICESIASTVTAPEIDDEAPSSMDEDDDADSDTTSAPSPSSLRIEEGLFINRLLESLQMSDEYLRLMIFITILNFVRDNPKIIHVQFRINHILIGLCSL